MKNKVLLLILFFVLVCLPVFTKADSLNELVLSTNKETIDLDGNIYKSDYISISNNDGIEEYHVKVINGGSNYVIYDTKGHKRNTFSPKERFIVISNENDIKNEEDIFLRIDATKDNKHLYGMVKLHVNYKMTTREISIKTLDSETNKMINGVTYIIYDKDNKVVKEVMATNYYATVSDLSYGDYRIVEKESPIGYKKSDIEKKINININSPLVTEVIFINDPLKSISIKTISSEDNSFIKGAELVIIDSENNVVSNVTTDNNELIINDLYYGTYTIIENVAPSGYKKIDEPITFTIDSKDNNKIINLSHDPCYGVKIYKLDVMTMKPISGSHLEILDSSGNVVKRFVSSNNFTIIDDLDIGLYTLREVGSLSSETFEIVDNQLTTIYFVNNAFDTPKNDSIKIIVTISIILGVIGYMAIVHAKKRFN